MIAWGNTFVAAPDPAADVATGADASSTRSGTAGRTGIRATRARARFWIIGMPLQIDDARDLQLHVAAVRGQRGIYA